MIYGKRVEEEEREIETERERLRGCCFFARQICDFLTEGDEGLYLIKPLLPSVRKPQKLRGNV